MPALDFQESYREGWEASVRRARAMLPALEADELEDVCQRAWLDAFRLWEREEIENLDAYLEVAIRSRGLEERRRRARRPTESLDAADAPPEPLGADEPDELLLGRERDAAFVRIIDSLSERQRKVVRLRFLEDWKPREIMPALGISRKVYAKEVSRALGRVASELEIAYRHGRTCELRSQLVDDYLAGVLGKRDSGHVEAHLARCAACRADVAALRAGSRTAAALVPVGILLEPVPTGGLLDQTVGLVTRFSGTDPTVVAGVRPGAVAGAVAMCLTVGTATYCAVEGVPPGLRDALGGEGEPRREPPQARAAPAPTRSPTTAPTPPPATPAPAPARSPRRSQPAPAPASENARAAEQEFGIEGAGSAAAPPAAAPPPAAPPPAEFGFE